MAWMGRLSNKCLLEVIYKCLDGRTAADDPADAGRFVLADAYKVPGGGRVFDLMALPDAAKYAAWADDAPICQRGTCAGCGSLVMSVAKHAVCPACDTPVDCT